MPLAASAAQGWKWESAAAQAGGRHCRPQLAWRRAHLVSQPGLPPLPRWSCSLRPLARASCDSWWSPRWCTTLSRTSCSRRRSTTVSGGGTRRGSHVVAAAAQLLLFCRACVPAACTLLVANAWGPAAAAVWRRARRPSAHLLVVIPPLVCSADKQLTNTGLERGEALAKDIAHMQQHWGLEVPVAAEDGPGHTYAK